jgi:hypothetical protein
MVSRNNPARDIVWLKTERPTILGSVGLAVHRTEERLPTFVIEVFVSYQIE